MYKRMSNLGGGAFNGISPRQTITNFKDGEATSVRKILRNAWNGAFAVGTVNGYKRITTPFRAVNNSGDFLGRVNYSCGGPNPTNMTRYNRGGHIGAIPQQCDATGVPASSCNVRFVADSSDYVRFRKEQAINFNYSDKSFGGNESNGSYVPLMRVRRR